MPTSTNVFNGTKILVYVDGIAIAGGTSHSLSLSSDMADITSKDSAGWKEILPTLKSWSIDVDSLLAYTGTRGYKQLFEYLKNRTKVSVKFRNDVSGDQTFKGDMYITSLDSDGPMEDAATFSCSLEGTGELVMTTIT